MSGLTTKSSNAGDIQKRSPAGFVTKVGVAATILLGPLVYAAQREQDPDIAGSQTVAFAVAGLLGTAVAAFLAAWGIRDSRRAGRTSVTLAVATLILLPLAWWSPLPIATGVAANRLGRAANGSADETRPALRVAALGGAVLAALGGTALVMASVVALI